MKLRVALKGINAPGGGIFVLEGEARTVTVKDSGTLVVALDSTGTVLSAAPGEWFAAWDPETMDRVVL